MQPNPPPPEASSTRERILLAAAEVFAASGYEGAGVDQIARHAGVNKAMLYYHVGDKQELFAEVVRAFIGAVRQAVAAGVDGVNDPEQRLRAIPIAFAQVAKAMPCWPQIMLRELAGGGTHLPDDALSAMQQVARVTTAAVADGHARGTFRPVDPLLTHLLLVGSMIFMANARQLAPRMLREGIFPGASEPSPEAMARFVTDVLLYGIAVPVPQGDSR